MNGKLRSPDQDCFSAHAHDQAALGFAFGPFRFVVVSDLRRHLPPRPARERPRYSALAPSILEPVSVDHHQKVDIGAMRVRAFAQPLQCWPIGEHEQLAVLRHHIVVGVAYRPYRAYLEAMHENVRNKGRQLCCRLHAPLHRCAAIRPILTAFVPGRRGAPMSRLA